MHSLELGVTGTIGPTSTTLVNPLDGRLMGNPSFMELTNVGCASTKVVVKLLGNTGHDLFEASQFVLKVLQGVMENVYFGVLLSNYLAKVAALTKS